MKEKKIISFIRTLRLVFIIVISIWLIIMYVFSFSFVRHSSMKNTLFDGDLIFVDKLFVYTGGIRNGDIIVFVENKEINTSFAKRVSFLFDDYMAKFSKDKDNTRLVKRVIAIEGDKVDIVDGEVFVNDVKINEPYVEQMTGKGNLDYPMMVGKDEFFVLGDNREVSRDSRTFGLIDKSNIEGKVVFRLLPFYRFGSLVNK